VASANAEMLVLYWRVGQLLDRRRAEQGWGAAVIPRLARDLANELPEVKGFSERNLKHMQRFHRLYLDAREFGQQPVAQLNGRTSGPPRATSSSTSFSTSSAC
jgi:DUF1016 N-terminal domain